MALAYDTITALVNAKYLPKMFDVIFKGSNYLWKKMMSNYKTYTERKIVVDLEYSKATTVGFVARGGTISIQDEELVTASEWTPAMMWGSLVILKEDALRCNSDMAVKQILTVKTNNLKKSLEDYCGTHIWKRGVTAVPTTNGWETIDRLVNNHATTAIGGIPSSSTVPDWWKSHIINMATDTLYVGCDATSEDDLLDSTKATYILRILQRGMAIGKYHGGGVAPDIICLPQYLYDLYAFIAEQKKQIKNNEKAGHMGFTLLDYNGAALMPDDYMVAQQTGDTDGRIYFLHSDNIYMYFNAGAKFTAEPFVQSETIPGARSSVVLAYGNMCTSNRGQEVSFQGFRSPKNYVVAA